MNESVNEPMDEQMDGWIDGWVMDGWVVDGSRKLHSYPIKFNGIIPGPTYCSK